MIEIATIDERLKRIEKLHVDKKATIDGIIKRPYRHKWGRTIPFTLEERNQHILKISTLFNRHISKEYALINAEREDLGKQPLRDPFKN